jgi:hypothetical protein
MRDGGVPPRPVLALSLVGAALALGNAFGGAALREAGARLFVALLFVAAVLAFGYCTASLIRSAELLAGRRAPPR